MDGIMANFIAPARNGFLRPEITGTCSASSTKDGSACDQPSSHMMTTGCEHEHVSTDELCGDCAEHWSAGGKAGILVCLWCDARRELISMTEISPEPGEEVLVG